MECRNLYGDQRRLLEELLRGRELANVLKGLLIKSLGVPDLVLVEKILDSFANSIARLSSGRDHSDEVSQNLRIKPVDSGDSIKSTVKKDGRGCHKRREYSESWSTETPTMSDDGYAWRKYGRKDILKAKHPRGSHHEEWDVEHSSKTLPKDDEARHWQQSDGSGVRKVLVFGQMFVVLNFILQLPPAVLGQLNSNPKPVYSFILMLLSYASLLLWIIELVYRWKRDTVTWRTGRGKQPLLYFPSPTNSKPFFSLADIVGLLSTILQSVFTTVNYTRIVQHTNTQIQISGWPIIFASVLLYSTFRGNQTQTDQPDHEPLQSIIIDKPTSECLESFTSPQDHFEATCWRYDLCSKITIEQVFAIVNFILELPSAVLDQLCSEPKPLYALILMLLSFASILLCIIELLHKEKTERVTWRWKRNGKVWWLYSNKPFFCFWDKVGLICTVVQPILSTVNYALVLQRRDQVQISVLPIVFALALSCSKIWKSQNMTESEGNINQRQRVTEPTASEEEKSGLTNQSQISVNEKVFPKPEKSVVENDNKIVPETEDGWVLLYTEQTLNDDEELDLEKMTKRIPRDKMKLNNLEKRMKVKTSDELQRKGKDCDIERLNKILMILSELIRCTEENPQMVKNLDNIQKIVPHGGIKEILKRGKTWTVEKTKESVWRKENELMREPTRRKTDNAFRRRVKSRR